MKLDHSYEQRQAVTTCDHIFRRGGLFLSTNPSLWAGMNPVIDKQRECVCNNLHNCIQVFINVELLLWNAIIRVSLQGSNNLQTLVMSICQHTHSSSPVKCWSQDKNFHYPFKAWNPHLLMHIIMLQNILSRLEAYELQLRHMKSPYKALSSTIFRHYHVYLSTPHLYILNPIALHSREVNTRS